MHKHRLLLEMPLSGEADERPSSAHPLYVSGGDYPSPSNSA